MDLTAGKTWDQSITAGNCRRPQREETGPVGMGGALCIDPEAASFKPQALTADPGDDRMYLERRTYAI